MNVEQIKETVKNLLNKAALETIESKRETIKPSIQEVKIIRRTHAKGGVTRVKKAKNDGEKTKLTGKSKAIRRLQGIKLKRSLRKQSSAKKRRKAFKFKKAMRKKGAF